MTRRHWMKGILGLAGTSALVAGGYSTLIAPHDPTVEYVAVRLTRLSSRMNGFTIVQLSDLHYGRFFNDADVEDVVNRVNKLAPQLVVLTGDYVTHSYFEDGLTSAHRAEPCAQLLSALRAKFGVIAVLGNHDYWTEPRVVHRALLMAGLKVLYNEAVPIESDGGRLWIVGLGDALNFHARLDESLARIPKSEPIVLLVHEPDFADEAAKRPVDLQLSGHSHGGQVQLPIRGPLILPAMARKYPQGLRRIGNLHLYTNRGLGTIVVPVRMNCPPEITHITLQSERK